MTLINQIFTAKDFWVVEKPAGLAVHNEERGPSLLSELSLQNREHRFFPVHRLDRETSGLQILALNAEAAARLSQEFQNRSVVKTYLGILRGSLENSSGVWNQPLSDKAEGRKNPAGLASQRVACETRYKVLEKSKFFTLCEFDLITGRQHQIRKHSALARHALVGDPRYGDPKYNAKIFQIYEDNRMFLHCHRIQIAGQNFTSSKPESFDHLDLKSVSK